ncbi:anti-sigma factor antagonist [Neobacillus citreus]|uniref:Anti-sigma factor antagonist n=1 Tax=Neobacillus citreus TaxID=2833578 RepID=A0A942T8A4_9BACI|nr:anti-sigma factor antagonist [Neobacillus citreus]MCH6267452.1 anti-sigma factor antagonist [Neobacillus citreus]
MNLTIDKQQNENEVVVKASGEIDAFTAPKLREELAALVDGKNKVITIDLKDVSYLDSTGLGVFVGLFKQLKNNGGELRLIEMSERLKRLFQITGLSHVMEIKG